MSLKPNGRAFVIKSTAHNQHLIGRVVTTLWKAEDGRWLCEGNLRCYGDAPPWPGEVNGSRVLFPAAWLCPIDEQPEADQSTDSACLPLKAPQPA